MKILKYSFFAIIPIISVLLCLLFRIAQGEKSEEIAFGVLLGIVLDFIYSIFLLVTNKISKAKKGYTIIVSVFFSLICVIIVGFVVSSSFASLEEKRTEWDKISEDYDIIADVAFDYYKEYIDERNTHNGTIFLEISEDGEFLTQTIYSSEKEDLVYYVNLTEKQKAALKNISEYYTGPQRQEIIMIKSAEYLEITDGDAVGAFSIIKSKEKPANLGNPEIYNLGNDWWQILSTGR